MIVQPSSSRVKSVMDLLLVAFLLVNAPNCHLSLVLASVVQGDAVNCNTGNSSNDSELFIDHTFSHGLFSNQYKSSRTQDRLSLRE